MKHSAPDKASKNPIASKITLYAARHVLPITSAAIIDGAVAVADTRIVDCDTRALLTEKFPEAKIEDFGEAIILPGFVNAHTHLELTAFRGFLEREENDFPAWLKKLTITRAERLTFDDVQVSATWGAVEAVRAGVTCVGDAADAGQASLAALCDAGVRGIVYQEVFGADAEVAREQFKILQEKVASLREHESSIARVGVSPHAPYTVSAALLQLIADYAATEKLSVMMHAAESAAETLLMREGRGPFAEGLARRGIEWRTPGISTIQYLDALGILKVRPLLAHCIRVDDTDIEILRDNAARIAHCPKSNAKLGHGRAPFTKFLKHRLAVGLGSDSVASNNNCDMLEEARFAALMARVTHNSENEGEMVSADDVLSAATRGGACALGLENETGALAAGMQADLTIVGLDAVSQLPSFDPATTLVFASTGRDVRMTMVAGRELYRDGRMLIVDEDRLHSRMKEINRLLLA